MSWLPKYPLVFPHLLKHTNTIFPSRSWTVRPMLEFPVNGQSTKTITPGEIDVPSLSEQSNNCDCWVLKNSGLSNQSLYSAITSAFFSSHCSVSRYSIWLIWFSLSKFSTWSCWIEFLVFLLMDLISVCEWMAYARFLVLGETVTFLNRPVLWVASVSVWLRWMKWKFFCSLQYTVVGWAKE